MRNAFFYRGIVALGTCAVPQPSVDLGSPSAEKLSLQSQSLSAHCLQSPQTLQGERALQFTALQAAHAFHPISSWLSPGVNAPPSLQALFCCPLLALSCHLPRLPPFSKLQSGSALTAAPPAPLMCLPMGLHFPGAQLRLQFKTDITVFYLNLRMFKSILNAVVWTAGVYDRVKQDRLQRWRRQNALYKLQNPAQSS